MTTEYVPGQKISAVYWTSVSSAASKEHGKVKIISKLDSVEAIDDKEDE